MKSILKKIMKDSKPESPKLMPWEVVRNITKEYPRKQQERILELLNQKLSPPNPYGNNKIRH